MRRLSITPRIITSSTSRRIRTAIAGLAAPASAARSERRSRLAPLRFRAEAPQPDQVGPAPHAMFAKIAEAPDRGIAAFGDRALDQVVAGDHGGTHQTAQLL